MPWSTEFRTRCVSGSLIASMMVLSSSVSFDGHLLAAAERYITHRPWKLAPDVPDGLHAGLHDLFLQLGGDQVQTLRSCEKAGLFHAVGELQDLIARQDQFSHQIHQFVQ